MLEDGRSIVCFENGDIGLCEFESLEDDDRRLFGGEEECRCCGGGCHEENSWGGSVFTSARPVPGDHRKLPILCCRSYGLQSMAAFDDLSREVKEQ